MYTSSVLYERANDNIQVYIKSFIYFIGPPNITVDLDTNYLTRAVKLTGNVFVYHGSPGIQRCYWTKNDKEIHGDTEESGRILLEGNFDKPSLTIKNVSPDDAGEYRLTARNDVGSRTSNVNVLGNFIIYIVKCHFSYLNKLPCHLQRILFQVLSKK